MSSNEFWEQDPDLLYSYAKYYELKQKQEDFIAWRQGMYNFIAVERGCYNILRGKGKKAENYLERPFSENDSKKEDAIKAREDKIRDRLRRAKTLIDKRGESQGQMRN